MSDSILAERSGGVCVLRLNRPEVLNAFNDDMGHALLHELEAAATDDDVRCVVITGEGRAFCSGEDLGPLADDYKAGKSPDLGKTLVDRYNPLIRRLRSTPKPVVAAINGVAAGAGVSLALACDFRIASEKAKLVLAFIKVGLIPDSGAVWFLSKMVGTTRAWQLAASGDPLDAATAKEWGLVDDVVALDSFEERWRSFAAELASGPTRAFALTKELVEAASHVSLTEQLDREIEAQSTAGRTADHMEGVQAFFAKRKPNFEGR